MKLPRRVVIVGNGMAGTRFVQELLERDLDRHCEITLIGDEHGPAYNRVLLSNVLAGVTRADAIDLVHSDWYAEHGVQLRTGVAVTSVDRESRHVRLADGTDIAYDVLVLATGSTPLLPPIAGITRDDGELIDGAAMFRSREDCAAISAWASKARRVIVVGAGVLGLEAARGLASRGRWVTVVQREDRLMERQLDTPAARALGKTLDGLGIDVRSGVTIAQVHGERVEGVTLSDGTRCAADMIVLCCGVRPSVDVAAAAGLAVNRGVVVDDRMRSVTDEDVYAIGECAEHDSRLYGLVAPVWEQARIAATVIADANAAARYGGSLNVTRLKAAGIELAAMGDVSCLDEDDLPADHELITFADHKRGVYQKLVIRDDRLVSAILLGDTRNAATLMQVFERGAALPADRSALLMVRRNAPATTAPSPSVLPARATICQCNGVTKSAICDAFQDGARTVDEIAARTRATTGCGGCRETVDGLVEWLVESDPVGSAVGLELADASRQPDHDRARNLRNAFEQVVELATPHDG